MNNLKAGKMVNIYATGTITGNVDGNLTIGHVEAGSADNRKDITLTINNGNLLWLFIDKGQHSVIERAL